MKINEKNQNPFIKTIKNRWNISMSFVPAYSELFLHYTLTQHLLN